MSTLAQGVLDVCSALTWHLQVCTPLPDLAPQAPGFKARPKQGADSKLEELQPGTSSYVYWAIAGQVGAGRSVHLDADNKVVYAIPSLSKLYWAASSVIVIPSIGSHMLKVSKKDREVVDQQVVTVKRMTECVTAYFDAVCSDEAGAQAQQFHPCILCNLCFNPALPKEAVLQCSLCMLPFHTSCATQLGSSAWALDVKVPQRSKYSSKHLRAPFSWQFNGTRPFCSLCQSFLIV
jgi:hypothetical protein